MAGFSTFNRPWFNASAPIFLIGDAAHRMTPRGGSGGTDWVGRSGPPGALKPETATALDIGPKGAVLVRPDGHEVARCDSVDATPRPGVAWLAPKAAH
jgi:hypothetical protein